MKSLLPLIATVSSLHAAPVAITWEPQPGVEKWRVWRGIDVVAVVTENRAMIDIPPQNCTFTVSAIRGEEESPQSKPLYLVAAVAHYSEDLVNWEQITYFVERKPKLFFRFPKEIKP